MPGTPPPSWHPQELVFLGQVGYRLPLPALKPAGQHAQHHLQRRGVDHGVEPISSAGLTDVGQVVEHYGAVQREPSARCHMLKEPERRVE